MTDDLPHEEIRLRVTEHDDVEAIVLAFRMDGELYELAELEPSAEAVLKRD